MNRNFYYLLASGSPRRELKCFLRPLTWQAAWNIPTFQSRELEALDRLGRSPLLVMPMYSVLGSETEQSPT